MNARLERHRQHGQMLLPSAQRTIELQFRLLPYWQAAAKREGYERIEDAIVGIYRETGSEAETARRLNVSRRTIGQKLKDLGEPTNGPGGPNNQWGRSGKPENDTELCYTSS